MTNQALGTPDIPQVIARLKALTTTWKRLARLAARKADSVSPDFQDGLSEGYQVCAEKLEETLPEALAALEAQQAELSRLRAAQGAQSPKVNIQQLTEVAAFLRELHSFGIAPASYDLSSPFENQVKARELRSDVAAKLNRGLRSAEQVTRDLNAAIAPSSEASAPQTDETTPADVLRHVAKHLEVNGSMALPCGTCDRIGTSLVGVHALHEALIACAREPRESHAALLKVWDEAIQVVESEEELDGPMPEANKRMAEYVGLEAHSRAVVRSTKRSILRVVSQFDFVSG